LLLCPVLLISEAFCHRQGIKKRAQNPIVAAVDFRC
jgi:hypothetical protein